MQIGILHHPRIPDSQPLAERIEAWLKKRKFEVWSASTWDETAVNQNLTDQTMLVVLGGDGSLLRAARLAMPYDVGLFGVNMGRVGFLCEAQPTDWQDKLARVLLDDFWEEKRLMVHATLERGGEAIHQFVALNDVVIGRGAQARVLRLHLWIDGDLVTVYTADALIVATPTGSTAYSMAAGGPLLPPQLQNFVVVPVAAHLSLDRPLVLHEEAEIAIKVVMDHEAMLTADGQDVVPIENGDRIVFRKYHKYARFIRVESSGYFYRRLMERLGYRE